MNLQQLRYVVATAEHRTMTDAARSLYIAQPALSRAIRDLERELGVSLFSRSGRGVVVTPTGSRVVKLAKEALEAVHEIEELAAQSTSGAAELRIATIPGLEHSLAGRMVPAYVGAHPDVRVRIMRCEGREGVVQLLREHRVELGLADLPIPADLVSRPLVGDPRQDRGVPRQVDGDRVSDSPRGAIVHLRRRLPPAAQAFVALVESR